LGLSQFLWDEPVKKEDMNIPPEQIEAIGELRKAGTGMVKIAEEFNNPLSVITKICKQHGWL
jgi:hypothetical protein